jgi:steroid delta-isomerase
LQHRLYCRDITSGPAGQHGNTMTFEKGTQLMATDFSFSTMLQHLEAGTALPRSADSPTEEHMRTVMRAYIDNINNPQPDFEATYLTPDRTGEDPVGSRPADLGDATQGFAQAMERLIDVPFTPKKAELISPISFSVGNRAAMAFKFWAEVDGRNISIDIVDVMTFDESGKICNIMAHWGMENVTLLD